MAHSVRELQRVKEEIALERPHVCNNCRTSQRLSHSHLVKASRDSSLYTTKENIVYHCLDSINGKGCHTKFESSDVATMSDFEANFRIIHKLDRQYFWIRMHKLEDVWLRQDIKVWRRVRALLIEIDRLEHPNIKQHA